MPEHCRDDTDLDRFVATLRDEPRAADTQVAEALQQGDHERARHLRALRTMDLVMSNHARGNDPAEQERLVRAVGGRLRRRSLRRSALLAAALVLVGLTLGLLWPGPTASDRPQPPPGISLRAGDQTRYRLLADGDGARLEAGVLHCSVDPERQPRRPWRIVTPHASAIVTGTGFTTRCAGEGSLLQVAHGAVSWQPADATAATTITAGSTAFAPDPGLDAFIDTIASTPVPDPVAIARAPGARRLLLGPEGAWRPEENITGWQVMLDGSPTQTIRLPLPSIGEQAVLRLACTWPPEVPLRLRYDFVGQLHRVGLPLAPQHQGPQMAQGTTTGIDLLLRMTRARTTALGPWFHLRYRLGQVLHQRFADLGALEHIALVVRGAEAGTELQITGAWIGTP